MRKFALFFLLGFFFLKCEKENAMAENPYDQNLKKWMDQEIDSYVFDLTVVCFCPSEFVGPNRIKVLNDEITEVNGLAYQESNFAYPTIDELFQFIEGQTALNPQVVQITYHSIYGYPTRIYIDQSDLIADEEMDYSVTHFVPLP